MQQLYTQEQLEEQALQASLFAKPREVGIDFQHGGRAALPTDKLRALLFVMEEVPADRANEK
ncbi:hypothetical protein ACIF80_36020 [Streptomyces sp. NPDC085927]|uniref:hypothetical protein n=1 Tax=Streptomyces sp. NPDC085927 TaxID=3365738 RepID=UPI0037D01C07